MIQFNFPDARPRERVWWLVVEHGSADLCRDDPGHEVTVIVESSVLALTDVWSGEREPSDVLGTRELSVIGPARDAKRLWRWLGCSAFASTRAERRGPLAA